MNDSTGNQGVQKMKCHYCEEELKEGEKNIFISGKHVCEICYPKEKKRKNFGPPKHNPANGGRYWMGIDLNEIQRI